MRPAPILFDRLKISVLILLYIIMAEWVDPRPFADSTWARLLYVALVLEITRQVWVWVLEWNQGHIERSQSIRERWDEFREGFSRNARFRVRRIIFIIMGVYVFGWAVDGLTSRCNGPFQCALIFPRLLVENLPTIIQMTIYIAIGMSQLFAMFYAMTKVGSFKIVPPGTINVTFDDVFGQDKARDRVVEQIALLEDSDEIEASGGYMPKGILLWGPPGTGKTMLAKAAANASSKPLILVPPGAFASTFIGINFLKVWMLFRTIRKLALRYDGVVVFIDEIDSLGNRGAEVADQMVRPKGAPAAELVGCLPYEDPYPIMVTGGGGMNMGTLEAFLAAMDGMDTPRGLINRVLAALGFKPLPPPPYRYLMIGATNLPSKLDAALTRAGRFGRKIHVPYPDYDGRLQTFQGYLDKVKHSLSEEEVGRAARDMHRGTGADIEDAVNEALLVAFRDGRKAFGSRDLLNAMLWREFGESDGQQEVEGDRWFVAVHEAGHAVAHMSLLSDYERIRFGTIEKRGETLGMIAPTEVADRPIRFRQLILSRVAISLASGVAERMFFGESTNGMRGDQRAATAWAARMVEWYGMSSLDNKKNILQVYDTEDYSAPIEQVMEEGWNLAVETLEPQKDTIQKVAELLLAEGTVLGSRIQEIYDEQV